jgi:hypothetical protein
LTWATRASAASEEIGTWLMISIGLSRSTVGSSS